MRARIAWGAAVLFTGFGFAETAQAECNCLYNNQRYDQEDVVCMATPQGMRMARCGMLDNIAWWEMLDEPCQGQVSALPPPRPPAFTPRGVAAAPQDAASSK